jgi:imidazole glycerol phosphate synthase, glutamine amidotransferase subunit
VDYNAGNIQSIINALNYLGIKNQLVSDPCALAQYDGLIIPGVGAFDDAMDSLSNRGMVDGLNSVKNTLPILGICLGMQLMCSSSEEGSKPGLGWINARVKSIVPTSKKIKVPHMGWNQVNEVFNPLFTDIPNQADFYFVHSYCVVSGDELLTTAHSSHGENFISSFSHNDIFGVQFHPEKSQDHGLTLLDNFAEVCHGKK